MQKIMAVVRGVQPRMAEINFYSYFHDVKIRYIGDKKTGWVVEEKIPKNVEFINLPLKPAWFFDPITAILGPSHAHRSWQITDELEKYLRDVDVINISDCFYFYCGQCAKLAKKLGKKLVAIVWENIPHHPSTYIPPYSFNVKAVRENCHLFIARSKKAANYLCSIGIKDERIKVIYKGISLKDFYPNFHKTSDTVRILYVGQLVKSKGVEELLEAFIRLYRAFQNIELWICARSEGEALERRVRELTGRFPLIWLGRISYDKLPEIYRQCDIYCQLSQDWKYLGLLPGGNEWFSYSIIEAMACGLPIVATKVGGIPEQLGKDNILVRQKNVETVYWGLKRLIEDKKLRSKIGVINRQRAEDLFDIEKQAKKTEEAILKLLT